ncbi:hypothetical protein LCGC14_1353700, partial [marine sediment metagenome]
MEARLKEIRLRYLGLVKKRGEKRKMVKCPKCKTIYAAKLVRAGGSFNNPPMIKEILKEEQYIKDNYKTQSTREMAEYLERSRPSVKGKCERLKFIRIINDVGYLISKGMRQLFKSNGKYWNRTLKNGIKYSKSTRRLFLLEDLGGKCVLCGMDDIDTLQFDDI